MQSPIAPPYEEALALKGNKKAGENAFVLDHNTDFSEADISTIVENENAMSVFEALVMEVPDKVSCNDTETTVDALKNLSISKDKE